jgi:mono/diheme cytochrome c family protein
MTRRIVVMGLAALSMASAASAQERDAGGFRAPTAALERGRAVYVLNHCHFCHGVDLTRSVMGAANLTESALVGLDTDGNAIGPLVKAGLPNLQTAMPSYRDLTAEQIVDLARYVHYLRQQARYRSLSAPVDPPPGDPAAGREYFEKRGACRSCHAPATFKGISGKYDATALRSRLLRPGPEKPQEGMTPSEGESAHLRLLESYTIADVQNLIAYLDTLR